METFDTHRLWVEGIFDTAAPADRDAMRDAARAELLSLRQSTAQASGIADMEKSVDAPLTHVAITDIGEYRRRRAVKQILANLDVSGFEPDEPYLAYLERYVRGELTLAQLHAHAITRQDLGFPTGGLSSLD